MEILDILILGSGPAALCLASELAKQNLNIKGISTKSPNEKRENTYGIWASDFLELGLENLLSHRLSKTVSFFGDGKNEKGNIPTDHSYDYGLINQEAFQNELLKKCKGIIWLNETAKNIKGIILFRLIVVKVFLNPTTDPKYPGNIAAALVVLALSLIHI